MKILTAMLFTLSIYSISESYASGNDIFIQQLKTEQELIKERELSKQTVDLEYAEQQRYLRQAEQDAKIRQHEDEQLQQEEKKRHWPQSFDVKHPFY